MSKFAQDNWNRLDRESMSHEEFAGNKQKTVVFHYHLFKNAGTSFDKILEQNFHGRCVHREFPDESPDDRRQIAEWVASETDAICFSSHTARLPPPKVDGIQVLPALFVRHPIDRIASVYHFERMQDDSGYGPEMAKNHTFRDYVSRRLHLDRQLKNFHVARLSEMFPEEAGSELKRALCAVETLPFVGIVEDFRGSLERFSVLLERVGLGPLVVVDCYENAIRDIHLSITQRLADIQNCLGSDLYKEVLICNQEDMLLYRACRRRFSLGAG